jgi:hypothetical protein
MKYTDVCFQVGDCCFVTFLADSYDKEHERAFECLYLIHHMNGSPL